MIIFFKIMEKGKKHYCTPYPDTLRELLKKFHSIDIERRWCFQCIHDLEEAGYISRQRRWKRLPGPEIRSLSSIYVLSVKGLQYLIRKGVAGARALLKPMLDWLHKNDNRRPTAADLYPGETITSREAALVKLKESMTNVRAYNKKIWDELSEEMKNDELKRLSGAGLRQIWEAETT